ncbi:MAG TPA: 16S rRNA (guanine(527)-N(7))-methyltransferase RsmG [Gammaproteobacteria bacterium]|nr:16S rRNA (guanine(527)-N(7))-methyltransferase RsmG [Gammaproteobacteria bacterium]
MQNKTQGQLQQGLAAMGFDLPPNRQEKLIAYVELLAKWNKAYNLTAVRAIDQMIPLHILDSLSLLPFMSKVTRVLDVGTGAGLPGVPLAIVCPEISFQLVDSQQKKINFIQHVITSLAIPNVTAMQHRIETLEPSLAADMVVSRAFASLDEFVKLVGHLCNANTKIVAMKGRRELALQEVQALPANFALINIESVQVPGINAERCLVFLQKKEG